MKIVRMKITDVKTHTIVVSLFTSCYIVRFLSIKAYILARRIVFTVLSITQTKYFDIETVVQDETFRHRLHVHMLHWSYMTN